MSNIHSDYLHRVYNHTTFKTLADRCITRVVEVMISNPFEAIAFSGTSGAAMAYVLSYQLGIPLLCVRKQSDKGHHTRAFSGVRSLLEGYIDAPTYLIVDDMISSGSTIRRIGETIRLRNPNAKCSGILLYQWTAGWHNPTQNVGTPEHPEMVECFFIKSDDLGESHNGVY